MNNLGDSANDEGQSKILPMNYCTLMAITRPLVIAWQASRSLGTAIFEDKAVSLEARYWWVEFASRKGEIICSDRPIRNRQNEEELATIPAPPQRGSDLRIRIHLGMS